MKDVASARPVVKSPPRSANFRLRLKEDAARGAKFTAAEIKFAEDMARIHEAQVSRWFSPCKGSISRGTRFTLNSREELKDRIVARLRTKPFNVPELYLDCTLADLGLDSIHTVELDMYLQESLRINTSPPGLEFNLLHKAKQGFISTGITLNELIDFLAAELQLK